jgi:hypothetical protein
MNKKQILSIKEITYNLDHVIIGLDREYKYEKKFKNVLKNKKKFRNVEKRNSQLIINDALDEFYK